MSNRTLFAAISAVALLACASTLPALAADEFNVVPGLTAAGAPLGLHGVDPVALVNTGKWQEGNAKHTVNHDGVSYYFTSKANADAFKAQPAAYIPQNGGFCTFGVSVGKKFDGDPRFAAVEGGKLYVFLNKDIYEMFKKDRAGTISKAATNWQKIQHTSARDL